MDKCSQEEKILNFPPRGTPKKSTSIFFWVDAMDGMLKFIITKQLEGSNDVKQHFLDPCVSASMFKYERYSWWIYNLNVPGCVLVTWTYYCLRTLVTAAKYSTTDRTGNQKLYVQVSITFVKPSGDMHFPGLEQLHKMTWLLLVSFSVSLVKYQESKYWFLALSCISALGDDANPHQALLSDTTASQKSSGPLALNLLQPATLCQTLCSSGNRQAYQNLQIRSLWKSSLPAQVQNQQRYCFGDSALGTVHILDDKREG